jgi:hypothetical protein
MKVGSVTFPSGFFLQELTPSFDNGMADITILHYKT